MQASVDDAVAQWCADHRVGVLDTISIWLADLSGALGVLALVAVVWVCFAVWFGGWRPMLQVVLAAGRGECPDRVDEAGDRPAAPDRPTSH